MANAYTVCSYIQIKIIISITKFEPSREKTFLMHMQTQGHDSHVKISSVFILYSLVIKCLIANRKIHDCCIARFVPETVEIPKIGFITLRLIKIKDNVQLYEVLTIIPADQSCCKTHVMVIKYLGRRMGKPTICICENKDADQLRSNCKADQRLCFRYMNSTIPLLSKTKISSL